MRRLRIAAALAVTLAAGISFGAKKRQPELARNWRTGSVIEVGSERYTVNTPISGRVDDFGNIQTTGGADTRIRYNTVIDAGDKIIVLTLMPRKGHSKVLLGTPIYSYKACGEPLPVGETIQYAIEGYTAYIQGKDCDYRVTRQTLKQAAAR